MSIAAVNPTFDLPLSKKRIVDSGHFIRPLSTAATPLILKQENSSYFLIINCSPSSPL